MSKIKRAITNNEILVKCLTRALKEKKVTVKEIKQMEKQLKQDFPYIEYDFSSLYSKQKKVELPDDTEDEDEDDETEDDE